MSQLKTKFIENLAVTTAKIANSAVDGSKIASDVALAGNPTTTTQSSSDNSTRIATTAFVKSAIESGLSGLDFQKDVLAKQVDATLDPGASPTLGDRYIITDAGALHANFGSIAGLEDNDIVQFDGSEFIVAYDVSVQGEGALVWNRDQDYFERFDGTSWDEFGGLAGVTAGDGLTKTGNTLSIDHDGQGLAFSGGQLILEIDGSTLSKSASGLKVADLGIDTAQLAADSVNATKINADVAGAGLVQNVSGALDVNVDGTTLKIDTDVISGLIPSSEIITLDGTDITNQYIDLAEVAFSVGSISVTPVDGLEQEQGVDYTVSLTGGTGGVTRITFAGDLATGGGAALVDTDKLIIKYMYL